MCSSLVWVMFFLVIFFSDAFKLQVQLLLVHCSLLLEELVPCKQGSCLPLADVCLLPQGLPSPSVRASGCLRVRVVNQDL